MNTASGVIEILETPTKPRHDKKEYRHIRLANGMKVILCTDDKVDEDEGLRSWPSCALSVDVGSLSDPIDSYGLAHSLGHMITIGDDEFTRLAKPHYNCIVDIGCDETTFTFVSRTSSFEDALERFAYLLKTPLNMRECMSKVREQMKSLFSYNASCVESFVSKLGNANHPSRNFPYVITNMDAIDDDTLYQRIEEFKNRHYSAHRMGLCLQTKLSLDEMQELAVKHFSSVPNNNLPGVDFTSFTHENAFPSKFHENVYFVKAQDDDDKNITFTWCVPSHISAYEFLHRTIHETDYSETRESSLNAYLQKKKWAYRLSSELHTNSVFSLFVIKADLTNVGLKNLDEFIETVFSHIRLHLPMLKSDGLAERLYRDFVNIEKWPRNTGELTAERLAKSLLGHPPKGKLEDECDSKAIHEAINTLNEGKFNITVAVPPKYDDSIKFELKEESCGVNYSERKMPDKWISLWNNPRMFEGISLPAPNRFIADDFTILHDGSQSVPKYPIKVYESDVSELWFRQDDTFLLPYADCHIYFKTSLPLSSIENITMNSLLSNILNIRQYQLHDMMAAHASVRFKDVADGIVMMVNAPNQNIHLVVNEKTMELKNFAENVMEEEIRKNLWDLGWPWFYASELRESIIQAKRVLCHDKFRVAKTIQLSEMQEFCRQYIKQMKIVALIQGNLNEANATSIIQKVETVLGCKKIKEQKSVKLNAHKLPLGASYLLVRPLIKAEDESASINYYQIGPRSHRTNALNALLERIATDYLRKKETPPISVLMWSRIEDCGILGYEITYSIDKEDPNHVADKCIDEFFAELDSLIENMTAQEFQKHVSAVMKNKLPGKLRWEIERNWLEIESGELLFDRYHQQNEILLTITKSELLQFYRDHSGVNERKLSIRCIPYAEATRSTNCKQDASIDRTQPFPDEVVYVNTETLDSGMVIQDVVAFKKSLEYFV